MNETIAAPKFEARTGRQFRRGSKRRRIVFGVDPPSGRKTPHSIKTVQSIRGQQRPLPAGKLERIADETN
jgi:hypothetical protein